MQPRTGLRNTVWYAINARPQLLGRAVAPTEKQHSTDTEQKNTLGCFPTTPYATSRRSASSRHVQHYVVHEAKWPKQNKAAGVPDRTAALQNSKNGLLSRSRRTLSKGRFVRAFSFFPTHWRNYACIDQSSKTAPETPPAKNSSSSGGGSSCSSTASRLCRDLHLKSQSQCQTQSQ